MNIYKRYKHVYYEYKYGVYRAWCVHRTHNIYGYLGGGGGGEMEMCKNESNLFDHKIKLVYI